MDAAGEEMNTATTAGMPECNEAGMTYTIQNTIPSPHIQVL